jgi:hypothetical protein
MFIGLTGYLIGSRISCDVCKLIRTSQFLIKKKKKKKKMSGIIIKILADLVAEFF